MVGFALALDYSASPSLRRGPQDVGASCQYQRGQHLPSILGHENQVQIEAKDGVVAGA